MKIAANTRLRAIIGLAATISILAGAAAVTVKAQGPPPPPPAAPPAQGQPAQPPANEAALALVGQPAPGFSLPDQNDKPHSLADSHGKWVVLAFYPKDLSKGCTFQNISYSRTSDKFVPLNAMVYTVSTQDTASKREFCATDSLTHTLLSDVGGKAAQAYGVLAKNGMANRVTFYIRPNGTVAEVDTKINTRQAGEDSLATLARLQNKTATTVDGTPVRVASDNGHIFQGAASQKATLGAPMPDFVVTDVATGKSAGFTTITAGKKAAVFVFVSTQCPVSNAYNDRMEKIASDYDSKGVAFVGLNANATETIDGAAAHAKAHGFTFPVYKDAGNKVADQLNANVTPEAFVTDSKGVLVYHGPIDNSQDPSGVTTAYLTRALDAVLAGQPVPKADRRAFGCSIKRQ